MVCKFFGRDIARITRSTHTAVATEAQRAISKEIVHETAIRDLKHRMLTAASRGFPQKLWRQDNSSNIGAEMGSSGTYCKPSWQSLNVSNISTSPNTQAIYRVRFLYRNGAQVRLCSRTFD